METPHRIVIVIEPEPSRRTHMLTLLWVCPVCGKPRGEPCLGLAYDGSQRIHVDQWENPCGHKDGYADVIAEAQHPLEADDLEVARAYYRRHGLRMQESGVGDHTGALALFKSNLPHGHRLLFWDTTQAPRERYLVGWEYEGRAMFQVFEVTGEGARFARGLFVPVGGDPLPTLISIDNAAKEIAALIGAEAADAELSEAVALFIRKEGGEPNRIVRTATGAQVIAGDFLVIGKDPSVIGEALESLSDQHMELARRAFSGKPSIIMGEEEALRDLMQRF